MPGICLSNCPSSVGIKILSLWYFEPVQPVIKRSLHLQVLVSLHSNWNTVTLDVPTDFCLFFHRFLWGPRRGIWWKCPMQGWMFQSLSLTLWIISGCGFLYLFSSAKELTIAKQVTYVLIQKNVIRSHFISTFLFSWLVIIAWLLI